MINTVSRFTNSDREFERLVACGVDRVRGLLGTLLTTLNNFSNCVRGCGGRIGIDESDYLHDAFRQSSYPTNCGKYFAYIPLSLVRMALHFAEANPPI